MRYGPTYRLPCCLDLFYVFLALFDSTFFRFLWKLVVPRLLMPFLSFYIFVVVLYIQGAFFLPSSVSTRRAVSGKVFLLRFCTIRRERLSQDNLSEYLCLGRIGTTVCVYVCVCVCVCVCVGWMRMSDTLYSLKKKLVFLNFQYHISSFPVPPRLPRRHLRTSTSSGTPPPGSSCVHS